MNDPSRKGRGLGTDVACICSTNFLAQILVSAILGVVISATGTELSIVLFGSGLAFVAAFLAAVFVVYKVPENGEDKNEKTKENTKRGDNSAADGNRQLQPSSVNSSPRRLNAGNPGVDHNGPV